MNVTLFICLILGNEKMLKSRRRAEIDWIENWVMELYLSFGRQKKVWFGY
jgi:hypothetical protein